MKALEACSNLCARTITYRITCLEFGKTVLVGNISLRPTVQYKIENKRQNYKFHVVLFVCTNIYK